MGEEWEKYRGTLFERSFPKACYTGLLTCLAFKNFSIKKDFLEWRSKWYFLFFVFVFAVSLFIACRIKSGSPNILFITIDTLRADRLGCYGYKVGRTPNVDALANDGVLFENARTAVPLTLPSHATMFTGLYPTATGVRDNLYYSLPDDTHTLAEVLKEHGYVTSAVVGAYVLHSKFGLAQGFDYYNDHFGGVAGETSGNYPERNAQQTADIAIEWLETHAKKKRFFLWVHFFDPHAPYRPPEPYASELSNPYDGEIAYTDYHLGRLLKELNQLGLDSNTVIIIAGDHGEGLGEHGESTHGLLVYDSTLRVPLIIKAPQWNGGKRISRIVSLVDVFPTVLSFAGIRNSEINTQGIDLANLVVEKGKGKDEGKAREAIYFESRNGYNEYGWAPLRGLVIGKYKYIEAPSQQLYDVESDPNELHNLADEEKKLADKLANKLSVIAKTITSEVTSSARGAVSEADVAKLRALGYISAPPQENDTEFPLNLPDPTDKIAIAEMIRDAMDELEKARPQRVLAILASLEARERENSRLYLLLGEAYEALGDNVRAEENYRKAIKIKPSDPFVLSRLGWTLLKLGKLDEAEEIFNLRAKYYPFDPLKLKHRAHILLARGKYQEAVEEFHKFIEQNDTDPFAHLGLAMAFQHLERYDEAIKEYRLALHLDPTLKSALLNIGLLLVSLDKHGEAKPYLEHLLELEPQNPEAFSALGEIYLKSGAVQSAIGMFEKALNEDPFNLKALENMALIYILRGSPQASFYERRYFESAKRKNITPDEQERVRREFQSARKSSIR